MREALSDAGTTVMLVNTLPGPMVLLGGQTADALPLAADAANDALTDAALTEDDLAWVRDRIADGLAEAERDPGVLMDRALTTLLANGDRRAAAITQRPFDTVAAVTVGDVRAWMDASFDADPIAVASGPLTPEDAGAAINTALAGLGTRSTPAPFEPIRWRTEPVTRVIDAPEAETALVALAFPAPMNDPSVAAALEALAGGDGSRLYERLREEAGATYAIDLSVTPLTTDWMTVALIGTVPPERAEETMGALREEVARLRSDGMTEAELARARDRVAAYEDAHLRDPGSLTGLAIDQVLRGEAISTAAMRNSAAMVDLAAINAGIAAALPAATVGVIVTPGAGSGDGDCVVSVPEDLSTCGAGGS